MHRVCINEVINMPMYFGSSTPLCLCLRARVDWQCLRTARDTLTYCSTLFADSRVIQTIQTLAVGYIYSYDWTYDPVSIVA